VCCFLQLTFVRFAATHFTATHTPEQSPRRTCNHSLRVGGTVLTSISFIRDTASMELQYMDSFIERGTLNILMEYADAGDLGGVISL
jgi:hypothetical protein